MHRSPRHGPLRAPAGPAGRSRSIRDQDMHHCITITPLAMEFKLRFFAGRQPVPGYWQPGARWMFGDLRNTVFAAVHPRRGYRLHLLMTLNTLVSPFRALFRGRQSGGSVMAVGVDSRTQARSSSSAGRATSASTPAYWVPSSTSGCARPRTSMKVDLRLEWPTAPADAVLVQGLQLSADGCCRRWATVFVTCSPSKAVVQTVPAARA